jgi:hypothetical protein
MKNGDRFSAVAVLSVVVLAALISRRLSGS